MLAVDSGEWDRQLCGRLDLPESILPPVVAPGTVLGELSRKLGRRLNLPPIDIVAPATHDTGSAVAGTPLEDGWAYISSGTWSLVGVETPSPIVTENALRQLHQRERPRRFLPFPQERDGPLDSGGVRAGVAKDGFGFLSRGGLARSPVGASFRRIRLPGRSALLPSHRYAAGLARMARGDGTAGAERAVRYRTDSHRIEGSALRVGFGERRETHGPNRARHPRRGRGQPQRVSQSGNRRCDGSRGPGRSGGGDRRRESA